MKKQGRKKRAGKASQKSEVPFIGPFPPLVVRNVRYVETRYMAESAATAGIVQVVTLNGLYDPDYTGAGSQPMYFDQLCTSSGPYTKYRVLSVRFKLTFSSYCTTNSIAFAYLSAVPTSPASLKQMLEKPQVIYKHLAPLNSGPVVQTIVGKSEIGPIIGVTQQHVKNDDYYAGAYNGNPVTNAFLIYGVFGDTGMPTAASASAILEIDFESQFFGLTNTGTS
jgi:hypothetical protein